MQVGTAPLSGKGHINISPKGGQKFGVIDERTFWYMDMTGSGVETHAHLHEPGNGRICVMVSFFVPFLSLSLSIWASQVLPYNDINSPYDMSIQG